MITLKKQHRVGTSDWSFGRLKYGAEVNPSKLSTGLTANTEVTFLPMESVSETGQIDTSEVKTFGEVQTGYTSFQNDDVIVAKITPCFENGKGAHLNNLKNGIGFGSTEFIVLRPNENTDSHFLYYLTFSHFFRSRGEVEMRGSAGQRRISDSFVKNFRVPKISIKEQQSIASNLDEKCALIDRIIEGKKKQIEILEEQRAAIINQAITKGLDENVEMKESGVEWIGQIPKTWELRKISHGFSKIGSGATPESNNLNYYDQGEINWVTTGELNDSSLYESSQKISVDAYKSHSALEIYPQETLLIAMYGATIGKIAILKISACTNQACCALVKSKYWMPEFAYYWFLSNRDNIINLAKGGGQPNISQSTVKNLRMQVPQLHEQKVIVEYLNRKCISIDNMTSKIEMAISLLNEYKTSLISYVVTGKINVTHSK